MLILGLDPGTTRIGYGLIKKEKDSLRFVKSGLLKIVSTNQIGRLLDLEKSFSQLLKKEEVDLAVLEKLFFVKNRKTGLMVAEARGILTLLLAKHKIPLLEYTPLQIKSSVSGYGLADKQAMERAILRVLKIKRVEGVDDAVDALAAAVTGATHLLKGRCGLL